MAITRDQKILVAGLAAVAGVLLLPLIVKGKEEEKKQAKFVTTPIFIPLNVHVGDTIQVSVQVQNTGTVPIYNAQLRVVYSTFGQSVTVPPYDAQSAAHGLDPGETKLFTATTGAITSATFTGTDISAMLDLVEVGVNMVTVGFLDRVTIQHAVHIVTGVVPPTGIADIIDSSVTFSAV